MGFGHHGLACDPCGCPSPTFLDYYEPADSYFSGNNPLTWRTQAGSPSAVYVETEATFPNDGRIQPGGTTQNRAARCYARLTNNANGDIEAYMIFSHFVGTDGFGAYELGVWNANESAFIRTGYYLPNNATLRAQIVIDLDAGQFTKNYFVNDVLIQSIISNVTPANDLDICELLANHEWKAWASSPSTIDPTSPCTDIKISFQADPIA